MFEIWMRENFLFFLNSIYEYMQLLFIFLFLEGMKFYF